MKYLSHFTAYMTFLLLLFIMLYLLSVLQSGVLVYSRVVFLISKEQEGQTYRTSPHNVRNLTNLEVTGFVGSHVGFFKIKH